MQGCPTSGTVVLCRGYIPQCLQEPGRKCKVMKTTTTSRGLKTHGSQAQGLHGWDLAHEPHVASACCCAASGWVPVLHSTFSRAAQCWPWDDSSCVPSRNGVQTQEGGRPLKHTSLHPPDCWALLRESLLISLLSHMHCPIW